ncbi:MAG: hypothetical protein ABSC94_12405 [Polyangiaceae bacterium]
MKGPAWIGLTAPSSSVAKLVSALAAMRGLRIVDITASAEELNRVPRFSNSGTAKTIYVDFRGLVAPPVKDYLLAP